MDVAPSNPCSRDLASACAFGSYWLRLKNSSEDIPFCEPNFWRAKFSSSSTLQSVRARYYGGRSICDTRVRTFLGSFGANRTKTELLGCCGSRFRAANLAKSQSTYTHSQPLKFTTASLCAFFG